MKQQGHLTLKPVNINVTTGHGMPPQSSNKINVYRGKQLAGWVLKKENGIWESTMVLECDLMIQGHAGMLRSVDNLEYPTQDEAKRQVTRAYELIQRTREPLRFQRFSDGYRVFYSGLQIGNILKIKKESKHKPMALSAIKYRFWSRASKHHILPYYWILDEDLCNRLNIPFTDQPSTVGLHEIRNFLCFRLYDNTPEPNTRIQREIRRSYGRLAAIVRQMTYAERARRGEWIVTDNIDYP